MTIVLFESLQHSAEDRKNLFATSFETILQTDRFEEVAGVLEETDRAVRSGCVALGFVCYEAGFTFLPGMPRSRSERIPLVWFALTRDAQIGAATSLPSIFSDSLESTVRELKLSKSREEYNKSVETIRKQIEAGDTYQVNFTMRYRGRMAGSARALYRELRQKQPVRYAAYIETEEWSILSLSPELFFRRIGNRMVTRPMKGTAARGRTLAEDRQNAAFLQHSSKERAENLMIVDLLRNDLGKICKVGSVEVTNPMQIERYETLLQMTSTVEGDLREQTSFTDIFRAMFPSGSVTGAPKIRTMQIIDRLEQEPRGIYTGAIGFHSRDESVFNVAIRTAMIKSESIEMGVGSGILHEADFEREYAECELKAQFLTMPVVEFQLIETILWTPEEGFRNLPLHLQRLSESSEYFAFADNASAVNSKLEDIRPVLSKTGTAQRIRLLVDRQGTVGVEFSQLLPLQLPVRVRLSAMRMQSLDRFLFHKTTSRTIYDRELAAARKESFFDVLFRNERDEITEGAISNIFVKKGDTFFTPPVSAGLLPGTYRRHLMESRVIPVEERILKEEDLRGADALFVCNAVRGLIRAEL